MEIKSLKCPSCGANIEVNDDISFCSYCGTKLYLDNITKNININYKNEDVAKIKEIEANKEIELKKIEDKKTRSVDVLFIMFLTLIGFIILSVLIAMIAVILK